MKPRATGRHCPGTRGSRKFLETAARYHPGSDLPQVRTRVRVYKPTFDGRNPARSEGDVRRFSPATALSR
jgi:hypothetical protein